MCLTSTLLILICFTLSSAIDPLSRFGLALPSSANSFIWTPIMTPRKLPSADDPSINEIDSPDFFPPHNMNKSTTSEKPNIVYGNTSGIVPGPNHRVGDSEVEWLTSTTTTTTNAPDTRVTAPDQPTSFAEFINTQLSLLMQTWMNFIQLTEDFTREIRDNVSSVLDFFWDMFVLIFSERKKRAIEYNISEL